MSKMKMNKTNSGNSSELRMLKVEDPQTLSLRYKGILAAVPDIIMEVDSKKIYTWANQAGLEFFGEEVLGKEASFYFVDEQNTYDRVQPLFNGDESVVYIESWQRRKDGKKRLLAWWCRVLKDTKGNVKGAISTARDITEQRRADEKIRLQNQLFENTIESLPHPFYVINANDYTIMMANKAAAILGSISEDTTCYALTHNRTKPCRGAKHVCPLQQVQKTKQPIVVEHIHYDKDRNIRHVEVSGYPIFDDEGNVVQMLVFNRDITERKLAEQQLRESEQRFHSVADSAHDAIITIDSDGKIVFWNKAAETIFGYKAYEIVGKPDHIIMPERLREKHQQGLNRIISTGKSKIIGKTIEVAGLKKDGCEFPLELSLAKWETKKEIFFTGILRDITERKRTETELQMANKQMKNNLAEAAKVQKSLLPSEYLEIQGVKFACAFKPCEELGGDIFNVFPLDDKHIGLYILDVSGHGVPAALLSVTLSYFMSPTPGQSSVVKQQIGNTSEYYLVPPAEVAKQLNRQFLMDPEKPQYFTLVYGILNLETNELHYVSAGHPGLIHLSPHSKAAVLKNYGLPIGCFKDANFTEYTINLKSGDRLYLFSDGITDAMNSKEKQFEEKRLISAIYQSRDLSLKDSISSLVKCVEEWSGDSKLIDDVSILAIEIPEKAADQIS